MNSLARPIRTALPKEIDRHLQELTNADGDVDKVDWTGMHWTFVEVLRSIERAKRVEYLTTVIEYARRGS